MLNLSAENLAAATGETPWPVDFVEIIPSTSDSDTHFRVCNHFRNLDAQSQYELGKDTPVTTSFTYTSAATLLGIGATKADLDIKEAGITISLSGLTTQVISLMLKPDGSRPIQGSLVYVNRGFINASTGLLVSQPYRRWAGFIKNYKISDDHRTSQKDKVTISVSCTSNLTTLLESKNGVYTSLPGFKRILATDKSMEFVPSMVDWKANFFKKSQ